MLVEISEDRYINPLSDNIIGIFPIDGSGFHDRPKNRQYVLNVGCSDGIGSYFITKEDRDLILKAMSDREKE